MDVRVEDPELQAQLNRWVADTGRGPQELIEDAMAGYFDELARVRAVLDCRYDDLGSGKVEPIPGEEIEAYFREKSAAARRSLPGP